MSERLFSWHERGVGFELHGEPGFVRAEVIVDRGRYPAELSLGMLPALVEALDGHDECVPADEHAEIETERDQLRETVESYRAEITRLLAEIEQHRTALDIADQRTRALEASFDPARTVTGYGPGELTAARATLAARTANEGLS